MDCYYINLANDKQKRVELERKFEAAKPKGWNLKRFEAIDKAHNRVREIQGNINDGAKGCFLSHQTLIGECLDSTDPLFITEDDAHFTQSSLAILNEVLKQINGREDWDLLFTDICVPNPAMMLDLYMLKKSLPNQQIQLLDLKDKPFASTVSYIVNPKSLKKIFGLLTQSKELNTPIDLYYRLLTHSGHIKSFVTFPFLTTLSNRSMETNIQSREFEYTETLWHTFRKFIWIDADLVAVKHNAKEITQSEISEESLILLDIMSGFFREKYAEK